MAYASQELKAKITKMVKAYCQEQGIKIKFSIKIRHHSELCLNIQACSIDLVQDCIQAMEQDKERMIRLDNLSKNGFLAHLARNKAQNFGEYDGLKFHIASDSYDQERVGAYFSKDTLIFMQKIKEIVMVDHYDNSDAMSDYFDTAYYFSIFIGQSKTGFKHLTT